MFKKIYAALIVLLCTACASSGQGLLSGSSNFGVVINDALMHGTATKNGVELRSDTGRYLGGHADLSTSNKANAGGGTSSFGGIGLPKWVDVSWRTGGFVQRYDPINHSVWTGGKVIGRYRIEVASRIPPEVLQYASAQRGRAIVLMFRILDDDVVLGWCVQEPPKQGGGWLYSNYGGDFMPAQWFNGKLVSMGWYLNKKTGQRVETTTGR